jgi:hypothetical protein
VEHLQHKIANTWTTNHSNIISHDPADASKVARYKRIMLKVSGEALAGSDRFGIEPAVLEGFAAEIKAARAHGIQIAVVVGGGNYFRGASAWAGLERATADYVGMLATVMNALCLQVCCSAYSGNRTRVVTSSLACMETVDVPLLPCSMAHHTRQQRLQHEPVGEPSSCREPLLVRQLTSLTFVACP